MFFVGQKVTCVNDRRWPRGYQFKPNFPKRGGVYTIRKIIYCRADRHDEDGLLLEEIINPRKLLMTPRGTRRRVELAFRMSRFRTLRATNIDIFTAMLEPQNEVRRFTMAPNSPHIGLPVVSWVTEKADA